MSNEHAVARRMKQQKLRRKARRGEIALRRLYKFIRFILIIAIFYGIHKAAYLHYWYFPSDLYNKPLGERIEILGNKIVPNEKILNEMRKFPVEHKPIYRINPEKMAHGIEQLSPVKRAYIRRFWFPARYVVMIEEVVPAIVIAPSENVPVVAAFAIDGEIISREYLPLKDECNAVKVLSYGTKGDDYEHWDVEKIRQLHKLAKQLELYSGENVEYIDLRNPHDIYAKIDSVKLRLGELDVSLFERIKVVADILPAVKEMTDPVAYIDLSWKVTKYIKMQGN